MDAFLERMRAMSAADLSVLAASAAEPGSSMTTVPGSANAALWSEMAKRGWMTTREEKIELPGRAPYVMTIYTIAPEGVRPIAELLAALRT
jgi:hypothetical protein